MLSFILEAYFLVNISCGFFGFWLNCVCSTVLKRFVPLSSNMEGKSCLVMARQHACQQNIIVIVPQPNIITALNSNKQMCCELVTYSSPHMFWQYQLSGLRFNTSILDSLVVIFALLVWFNVFRRMVFFSIWTRQPDFVFSSCQLNLALVSNNLVASDRWQHQAVFDCWATPLKSSVEGVYALKPMIIPVSKNVVS